MTHEQLKAEYPEWARTKGVHLRSWRRLTSDQKWFVFVNAVGRPEPRVSKARTVKEAVGMIWSRTN